jgi:phosphatidylglycerophosphate synthase
MTQKPYSYGDSVKSDVSDELVNVYVQRPIAGLIARLAYSSPLTPNQFTIVAVLFGMAGAILLSLTEPRFIAAALCFYVKDLFDSVDGQLARAKQLYSRRGRFLDSIGDFVVNLSLFGGIFVLLVRQGSTSLLAFPVCLVGFLGIILRVSYHVFYQSSFLHTYKEYQTNRISEEFKPEDYGQDAFTVRLQTIFLSLYGWQDRLMNRIDVWSRRGIDEASETVLTKWYRDTSALQLSGFLGLGTEFVLLTVCLLLHNIELYLFISIGVLNCLWVTAILYRRVVLVKKIVW